MGVRGGRKALLAIVSIVLLLSMGGGFLLLPLLVPLHVWAARGSGPVGRALWSVIPVAAVGMVAWSLVYVTVGEQLPWIWLVPVAAAFAGVLAMARLTDRTAPIEPSRLRRWVVPVVVAAFALLVGSIMISDDRVQVMENPPISSSR